ncbi:putative MOXD1 1-like 2 [Homarus americanus]|uniref:Putative MOXD1 1-like 2 n=1 Tax=Homarus americanus TaxID=6706 RepID=A0A8J5MST6_HOMAM|nr:putative MOXD1 1-like 2 [Homarus americanus]
MWGHQRRVYDSILATTITLEYFNVSFYDILYDKTTWQNNQLITTLQEMTMFGQHEPSCENHGRELIQGLPKKVRYPDFIPLKPQHQKCTSNLQDAEVHKPETKSSVPPPTNQSSGEERKRGKRENNSHIDCGCPREKKIPVLELEFIKAQRTKAEGQGSMQMGSIDYSETKKQIANAKKREQIREREQKKKMKSEEAIQREEELCQDVYHFFDSSSDEQEATSDDSSKEPSEPLPKKMKYNTRNISNIALASIRHHAGLREAAEIATAAWIDAGLISREDVSLSADPYMVGHYAPWRALAHPPLPNNLQFSKDGES